MDDGDIIGETIKQVGQSVNQTLPTTITGNSISNLTQNNPPHDHVSIIQLTHDSIPGANMLPSHAQPVLPIYSITHPDTGFEQAKQIIMYINTLSHSPTVENKILQELNLHGLCKYNSTQAYLYENSNKIVNCAYTVLFLKQSTCYAITTGTHQWYRVNNDEITDNHKIALCNDPAVHMVPLSSAAPSEVHAVEIVQRPSKTHHNNTHP